MLREIIGTRQSCIHNSLPLLRHALLDVELQLFPVRIDHCVDVIIALRSAVQAECQAARFVRQINGWAYSVPGDILAPEPAATQGRMSFPERNHAFEETKDFLVRRQLAPIQPSRLIVLVVGIVVAELGVEEFISGSEHGRSV